MQNRYVSPWALAYLGVIVAVNIGFTYIHPIDIGFGMFSPMAIVVGFVFIFRDFAQRDVGDRTIFVYMLAGLALSYLMADPFVALASALAFVASELADWAVFTYTRKPLRDRIIISNAISIPVDTLVFLTVADFYSTATFIIMVLSKLVATVLLRAFWPKPVYREARFEDIEWGLMRPRDER